MKQKITKINLFKIIKKSQKLLLFVVLLASLSLVMAADYRTMSFSSSYSNVQYFTPNSYNSYSMTQATTYWPNLSNAEKCEANMDFYMNIRPDGCTPRVVRSDLLEEQNVPVFCRVDILKLNPLIEVSQIKSVSYNSNGSNKYIAGVGFHPNREAIYSQKGFLNNPLINDAGYVVVVLKRIPAEKDMPDSIKVNLTGALTFDAFGFYGSGSNNYYLKPVDNEYWGIGDNYKENSIFKGQAYLRAEDIESSSAKISVYADKDTRISSLVLQQGQTSNKIYLPGFYCKAGFKMKLDAVTAGFKRVQLEVDDNTIWLTEGEKFLDNKCKVVEINIKQETQKKQEIQSVEFESKTFQMKNLEDEQGKVWSFSELENVNLDNVPKLIDLYNKYESEKTKKKNGLLIVYNTPSQAKYITKMEKDGDKIKLFSGTTLIDIGSTDSQKFLKDLKVSRVSFVIYREKVTKTTSGSVTKSVKISCPEKTETLSYSEGVVEQQKNTQAWWDLFRKEQKEKQLSDAVLDDETKRAFDMAKAQAQEIENYYGSAGEGNEIFAAKAFYKLALLAEQAQLNETARNLFLKLVQDYADTPYAKSAGTHLENIGIGYLGIGTHKIRLIKIESPSRDDASASFSVTKSGNKLPAEKIQETETFANVFRLVKLYPDKVDLVKINDNKEERFNLSTAYRTRSFDDYQITLDTIYYKKTAKVTIKSFDFNFVSQADFPFEVGIEKRAIELSPDKTRERIKNLNKTIAQWENIVKNLGKIVEGWKAACLATSAVITAKNFFMNLGGGATARQAVMPQWYKRCEIESGKDQVAFNKCLKDHGTEIDNDISIYQREIQRLNTEMTAIQNTNKFTGTDTVDTKKAKEILRGQAQIFSYFPLTLDEGGKIVQGKQVSVTSAQLDAASYTDLRDLIFNQRILNSGASETARLTATGKIDAIVSRLDKKVKTGSSEIYEGGEEWLNSFSLKYYSTGKNAGLPYIIPLPKNYGGKTGFYVIIQDANSFGRGSGFTEAGEIKEFWIQNVGKDGRVDPYGDEATQINMNWKKMPQVLNLSPEDSEKIIQDAIQAIEQAKRQYGSNRVSIFGREIPVDKSGNINEKRCQDFMSPEDCQIIFNVCDPVVCPSSRCNLGGAYRVDNVIQSGIIGSIALCLPNINEGIVVPVCISGVYAGLEAYISILKAHRDCLQENLNSGRMTGICDEIYSIYLCEFFWRQIGPYIDLLLIKFLETIQGQGMRGGGEYLTVQDSWKNMESSINYLKNEYSANAFKTFEARNTGDIGAEFCKMYVSSATPDFKELLEPESPYQFAAWFDEISYTEATAPATSQYKVFYHIYAGKDEGISYQVYLTDPPKSAYIAVQNYIVVDTNYIPKGGFQSQTRDFTAPAGYKQVCVRINGKDECGFKKVTTNFAINYVSDAYYTEMLSKTDIKTREECTSGSPSSVSDVSALGLLQTGNIQEGVETVINPQLEKKGVVRVCSSTNPGQSTSPQRWKEVGFCDNEDVKCWLDIQSVQDVIKNKNMTQQVINSGNLSSIGVPVYDQELINSKLKKVTDALERFNNEIKTMTPQARKQLAIDILDKKNLAIIDIDSLMKEMEDVRQNAPLNNMKAKAVYYESDIYYTLAKAMIDSLLETKKDTAVVGGKPCSWENRLDVEPTVGDNSLIRDNEGNYWKKKGGSWIASDELGKKEGTSRSFNNIPTPICLVNIETAPAETTTPATSPETTLTPTTPTTPATTLETNSGLIFEMQKNQIYYNNKYTGLYLEGSNDRYLIMLEKSFLGIDFVLEDIAIGQIIRGKITIDDSKIDSSIKPVTDELKKYTFDEKNWKFVSPSPVDASGGVLV